MKPGVAFDLNDALYPGSASVAGGLQAAGQEIGTESRMP